MRIFSVNNTAFKGLREDRNQVQRLSVSASPIGENTQRNIYDAINNLSNNPSDENIKFLISTAQNLAYGVQSNSEFQQQLLATSPLKGKKLANNDWETRLKQAIMSALALNTSPDKKNLETAFQNAFSHAISLSPDENTILEHRKRILKSPVLSKSTDSKRKENIMQNLDYFIFSSEISIKDKAECLEKIAHFLSNKYKINPQLKDKKLQVLDEILNDIIIKNPEKEILTIKDVNQKHHGMCGAISVCRKLLAYMDKKNYLDNIFEELSASPNMKIYDITRLGSGKKIPVKKVYIDFEDALAQKYRIIDASALQWMQNASRTGDGNFITSQYIPFDKEKYQTYADSFWIANFPEEVQNVHETLKSAITARSLSKQIRKRISKEKYLKSKKTVQENTLLKSMKYNGKLLEQQLQELFPKKSQTEVKILAARILNLQVGSEYVNSANYKRKTPESAEFIINPNDADSLKKSKISALLNILSPNKSTDDFIEKIFSSFDGYVSAQDEYNALKNAHTPRAKARLYHLLFKYATAYQDTLEKNLDEPFYAEQCLLSYNLPTRKETIRKHFNAIISCLQHEQKPEDLSLLAEILNAPNDRKILHSKMQDFISNFEQSVENETLNIIQMLGFKNKKDIVLAFIEAHIENIKTNDKEEIAILSKKYKINPTKFAVLKKLNRLYSEIKTDTYKGNLDMVLDDLGIKNEISFFKTLINLAPTLIRYKEQLADSQKPIVIFLKKAIENNNSDFQKNLSKFKKAVLKLEKHIISVEDTFNVPTPKEVVLFYHRKNGEVLNADEFEILNKKFLEISRQEELADTTEEKMNIAEVYKFSKQEKEILNKIIKNFNFSEKYVNKLYNEINRKYKDELAQIYNEIGRMNGDFWTKEEGSSGLYDQQELKILEQMTGKPFHVEYDLLKVIEQIKQGKGEGQINTNVCDDEFSGHAQFLMGVTPIITRQGKTIEGVWHDNSWGRNEYKNNWHDENGLIRTDYQNGTGGKDGFIVRPNGTTGWDINYLLYGKGIQKPRKTSSTPEGAISKTPAIEYSLFDSALLPNEAANAKVEAERLLREMLNLSPTSTRLKSLLRKIEIGEIPNIKVLGENFDKLIQERTDAQLKQAMKIKSKEDFEKLDENNPIKIALKKLALLKTNFGYENKDIIENISTQKEIDEYNAHLLNKLRLFTESYLEQNIMLVNNAKIKKDIINYIDTLQVLNKSDFAQLKSDILKTLRVQLDEINNGRPLKEVIKEKIRSAVYKNTRFNPLKEKILQDIFSFFDTYYNATFSTEKILYDKDFAPILKLIDNKFNPQSNEEVKKIVENLRKQGREGVNKLLKHITLKDFGIEYQDPYHILKVFQSNNFSAQDKLDSMLFGQFAREILPNDPHMKVSLGNNYDEFNPKYDQSVNSLYRSLFIELSYTKTKEIINRRKDEYLKKYSIRASYPNVEHFDKNKISELVDQNLDTIQKAVYYYKGLLEEEKLLKTVEKLKNADITDKNENYYNKAVLPLLTTIYSNDAFSILGKDCIDIVNSLCNNRQLTLSDKFRLVKKLQKGLLEIEPDFNLETLEELKANHLKKIKGIILMSANGFIIAQNQRANLHTLLKNYTTAISKNKSSEEIAKLGNEIKEYTIKHCVLKNPADLLNEIIKLKIQDKNSGTDANQKMITSYMDILEEALDAAHRTEVECKILEEINSGRIYDLKKNLAGFEIPLKDGSVVDLLSDKGIYMLFHSIYNGKSSNPMSTVNLLCQNTGLADDFSRVISANFDLERINSYFISFYERIKKMQEEFDIYENTLEKTLSQKPNSYTKAVENYKQALKENLGRHPKTLSIYLLALDEHSKTLKNISDTIIANNIFSKEKKVKMYQELLKKTHQKCINEVLYEFQDKHVFKFNSITEILDQGIDILENLHLSEFSPQKNIHDKTLKTMNLLKELNIKITNQIEDFLDKNLNEASDEIKIEI